jgi:hypothetical protein
MTLRRTWKAVRFSWWFTSIMHKVHDDAFNHRVQLAELDYLRASKSRHDQPCGELCRPAVRDGRIEK